MARARGGTITLPPRERERRRAEADAAADVASPRARRRLDAVERALAAVILASVAVRVLVAASSSEQAWDVNWFEVMARSLLENGAFVVPWESYDVAPVHTHHFPPLYPALLAAAYAIAGHGHAVTQAVSVASGLLLVGVTYLTTRDLFDSERALAATAIVAAFPVLVEYEALGFSESLVVAFFALTIWAIVRSLQRPPFIVLAGLFAGLGYLTKASMGSFFLVAGGAGFAWRFAYVRWGVLKDRWYLGAAALFAVPVALWTARNVRHFGLAGWETQPWASESLGIMLDTPAWPGVVAGKAFYVALILLAFAAPVLGDARRALTRWRDPAVSGLLMAIVTPTLIAVAFVSAFKVSEDRPLFDLDNKRYVLTALVPLLWLALGAASRHAQPPSRHPWRARLLWGGVAVVAAAAFLNPLALAVTMPRFAAYAGAVTAGVAVAAASLFFLTRTVERHRGRGDTVAVTTRAPLDARAASAAAAFLAVGLAAALWVDVTLLPFFAAAALASCFSGGRARFAAIAIVLLATAASGAHLLTAVEGHVPHADVASEIEAHGLPDGTVIAVTNAHMHHVAALLPWDGVRYQWLDHIDPSNADYVVLVGPAGSEEFPHHVLVRSWSTQADEAPGARAMRWIEDTLLDGAPPPRVEDDIVRLYVRADAEGARVA